MFLYSICGSAQIIDPSAISGLNLWLMADSGVVLNGSQVQSWTDYSGQGNHASAGVISDAPQLIDTSKIKTKKVIRFNGINNYLISNASYANNFTLFIVSRQNNTISYQHLIEPKGGGSYQLAYNGSRFQWLGQLATPVYNTLDYHFLSVKREAGGGSIYLNGVLSASGSVVNSSGADWVIGRYNGGAGEYLNGDIAEILLYNIALTDVQRDSVELYLRSKYSKFVSLGNDIQVNKGFCDTTISAGTFKSYLWSTGSTDSSIAVSQPGAYWVEATDMFGYKSRDTINVSYPLALKKKTILLCQGDTYSWNTALDKTEYSFQWQDNSTDSLIKITKAGQYFVKVTDSKGCFVLSDTLTVQVDSFPLKDALGSDISLCTGNYIGVKAGIGSTITSYKWNDNSTDSTLTINTAGKYFITLKNINNCINRDSINVSIKGTAPKADFSFTKTCLGDSTVFTDLSVPSGSPINNWQWNFGDSITSNSNAPVHKFDAVKTYTVRLTVQTAGGCSAMLSKLLKINSNPHSDFNQLNSCSGGTTKFIDLSTADTTITSWSWDFGDTSSGANNKSFSKDTLHYYKNSGRYTVIHNVKSINGCSSSFSKELDVVAPTSPIISLLSPYNNQLLSSKSFTFSWENKSCVLSYEIELSEDSNFSNIIFSESDLQSTHITYNLLQRGKTYYWHVRSNNGINNSPWSNVNQFKLIDPLNIGGLNLWLMADSGVVLNGSQVQSWTDYSGQGNHASAGVISDAPQLIDTSKIKTNKVIRFNGTNNYLTTDASYPSSFTLFVVTRQNNAASFQHLMEPKGGGSYQLLFNGSRFQWLGQLNTPIYNTLNYHFFSLKRDTGIGTIYLNGVLSASGNVEKSSGTGWVIGKYNGGAGEYLNGDIAEILLYSVALTDVQRDSVELYLRSKYSKFVSLGNDIQVNKGFCDTTISAGKFNSYLWSTGSTGSSIAVNRPGAYWVEATDMFGYKSRDTINVSYPLALKKKTIVLCQGDTYSWNTALDKTEYSFQWQDNSTDSLIKITKAGQYFVKVTDSKGCFVLSDTLTVQVDSFPLKDALGSDISLCTGNYIGVKAGIGSTITSYKWNDNSTDSTLTINTAGKYFITLKNINNCINRDSINVSIKGTAPKADFSFTKTCLGDSTVFTDLSVPSGSPINNWQWNFGDSITSNSNAPVHKFNNDTVYLVNLTITSLNGCESSITKTVTVNSLPKVNFVVPDGCSGKTAFFKNVSTIDSGNIDIWFWNFGDTGSGSSDSSSLVSPTHKYTNAGTYIVKLKAISDSGCINSVSQAVIIKASPPANFTYPLTCEGNYVLFNDITVSAFPSNVTKWNWDFGDGSPNSIIENPSHLYNGAGTFNVTMTVTGSNNCTSSITKVVMTHTKPKVGFTLSNACAKNDVVFTNTTTISNDNISSWKWSFGALASDTAKNPVFVFPDTGKYSIKLIAESSAGCKDSMTRKISVFEEPQAKFSYDPLFGSAPLNINFLNKSKASTSYSWDFGDNSLSEALSPSHIFETNDTFRVCLTAKNIHGCQNTLCKEIRVIPSQIDIALKEINYSESANTIYPNAIIINLGTRDLYNFDIMANLGNGTTVHEIFSDTLKAGESLNYFFKGGIGITPYQELKYLCVELKLSNIIDENLLNNKQCLTLSEELQMMELYPNPAMNSVNIQYVLPAKDLISIQLFDEKGVRVKEVFGGESLKGLNEIILDIADLNKGVYTFKVIFRNKVIIKKLLKL